MKIKNQKPIEIDAHFKYLCPKCGLSHWLSLRESKVKNFKVVCDCKTIFKPKRIKSLKIAYKINSQAKKQSDNPSEHLPVSDVIEKASKLLVKYGFTEDEARSLLLKTYNMHNINNSVLLVKQALQIFGRNNNE